VTENYIMKLEDVC